MVQIASTKMTTLMGTHQVIAAARAVTTTTSTTNSCQGKRNEYEAIIGPQLLRLSSTQPCPPHKRATPTAQIAEGAAAHGDEPRAYVAGRLISLVDCCIHNTVDNESIDVSVSCSRGSSYRL